MKISPLELATRNLFPFLFTDSVYHYYHAGIPAQIKGFTPDQVEEFWNKQKVMPWTLAIAGEFNRDEMIEFAKSLPVPTAAKLKPFTPTWNTDRTKSMSLKDRNQNTPLYDL